MTKNTILVNGVEIEKSILSKLLLENEKLKAVKYVCEKANIGLLESKNIVEQFQAGNIDNYKYQEVKKPSFLIERTKPRKFSLVKKMAVIFGVMAITLFLFLYKYIGFQHIPHHIEDIMNNGFPNVSMSSSENDTEIPVESVEAVEAIQSPMDTLIWVNAKKNNHYIPENVLEEWEIYKKIDFSKLIEATDKPTNKEAQAAIVRHYKGEVIQLLEQYQAHIQIGKCYNAPLQFSEKNGQQIARVTAMVSAFNTKNDNLGNIQRPLNIVYDFVKYESDPDTWYITDFSQSIPFDYVLNADRW